MSKSYKDMSQAEKMAAIGAAANGGEMSPEAKAYLDQVQQNVSQKGWNLPIIRKPDPEADANSQMNAAVNGLNPQAPAQPSLANPLAQQSGGSQLTPEQQAILKDHIQNVMAPPPRLPGMPLPGASAPARPQDVDPATLMQQQGKPMPSDDVESQDLQKQYYKQKAQGQ